MNWAGLDWSILENSLWAGVAALGFAFVFNVPVRTLAACAIAGALGYAVRSVLMSLGAGIEEATLAAAVVVGFLGWLFAHIWKAPALVFSIPGVIPMVPGSFAFRSMIGMVLLARGGDPLNPDLAMQTAVFAAKTALVLGAIAVGISIPKLLLRRYKPLL
ncbi:MAG: threonine/serine exporter family protein [Anaerolineae bacterium]